VIGESTEVKAQPELSDNVDRQRAKDVCVPLGQSIDAQGHDDLSDELDKGGLNNLDHHQVIAPVGRERGKRR
jgi:hypothetical protein